MSVAWSIVPRLTPDQRAEIAAWTAEVEAAKTAYDEAPSAWADQLAGICRGCHWGQHYRCTARRTMRGPTPCTCRGNKHPSLRWWL